jgi:hypothetical protein
MTFTAFSINLCVPFCCSPGWFGLDFWLEQLGSCCVSSLKIPFWFEIDPLLVFSGLFAVASNSPR